jgi:hypothetical protein
MTIEEITWMKNWTYRICSLWPDSMSWKQTYKLLEKTEKNMKEGNPILSKEAIEMIQKSYEKR